MQPKCVWRQYLTSKVNMHIWKHFQHLKCVHYAHCTVWRLTLMNHLRHYKALYKSTYTTLLYKCTGWMADAALLQEAVRLQDMQINFILNWASKFRTVTLVQIFTMFITKSLPASILNWHNEPIILKIYFTNTSKAYLLLTGQINVISKFTDLV